MGALRHPKARARILKVHSLNLASRTSRGHGFCALYGRDRRDAKIVRGRPQPHARGMIFVARQRYKNIALPGRIHVTWRILGLARNRDMLPGQRLREVTQRNRLFHLHVNRKGMSMENWRLDQLNRWLQRVFAGDSLVVLQQSLPIDCRVGVEFGPYVSARLNATWVSKTFLGSS